VIIYRVFVVSLHSHLCTCGSQKNSQQCCAPYLQGKKYPKTPEKLMRSRYSAFALGGHGQYLLDTWLPSMTQGLTVTSLSQKDTQWRELHVLSKSQSGDDATVEFNAIYLDANQQSQSHHEHSVFKRIHGKWLYVGGEVNSGNA
jgi:SEC-C motif-containing protein